jgi:putative NADH-flavin reductase
MKIVVFGAAGRTGRNIVGQGLKEGHEITAFVHKTKHFAESTPGLLILTGDVLSAVDVENAVANQDAVVSALGVASSSRRQVLSIGTRNIINAMKRHGVHRLIVQSAHGAGDSSREMSFIARVAIRGVLLKPQFDDKDLMERFITESDLEWTIVRPTRLTNGRETGKLRVGERIPIGRSSRVSRADVAHFMLDQLRSAEYIHRAPTITH